MALTLQRWDTRYDFNGRKRKKKTPKGEVYEKFKAPAFKEYKSSMPSYARSRLNELDKYQSRTTDSSVAQRPERLSYTGSKKLLGVATMHKSNMVPVFEEDSGKQYAKDLASMRR